MARAARPPPARRADAAAVAGAVAERLHTGARTSRARIRMDLFPRAFLLVFGQLAVGGMFCLSIPPFHDIERGYYKSSAFVFVLIAALALAGGVTLYWRSDAPAMHAFELLLWAVFVFSSAAYLATLWGERYRLRARLFTASWLSGAAALIAAAESYRDASLFSLETVLFPASFLLSAVLLGAASSGMLLGHWYLIDRDLSLQPLWRIVRLYRICLTVQMALLILVPALLFAVGNQAARDGAERLLSAHLSLLAIRVAASPLAAAGLGWMIDRTLRVPQTMAATGLFYIAVLAVLVGEFMGRFLLFRTGLPL
jgi:hypothetical protein